MPVVKISPHSVGGGLEEAIYLFILFSGKACVN